MSDCPDCDNIGFTYEFAESRDDELRGDWYKLPCRNWRHSLPNPWPEIHAFINAAKEPSQ